MNIEMSVISVSMDILTILVKEKVVKYNDLYSRIISKRGNDVRENFLLALNFLFILKKISYHQSDDVVELV